MKLEITLEQIYENYKYRVNALKQEQIELESTRCMSFEKSGRLVELAREIERFSIIREALEKQIAKKPVWVVDVFECPCCGEDLGNTDNTEYYCWNCGQKLDWGNEE